MATNNITPYSEKELAVLVEEYITQQRKEFTLKGLTSYIVYWGMEDKRIQGDRLTDEDNRKVNDVLARIVKDGRIRFAIEDNTKFIKQ